MAFDTRFLTGLNVLAAVLDAGNFVRAGQMLGLTQSGVSRSIQRLEQRLEVRLFERTSKSMRLTDDGKRFCEEVLPLLSRLEEVAEGTIRSAGVVRGRLRINVDPTFARLVLAPRVALFLKKYPELQLDLIVRDQMSDFHLSNPETCRKVHGFIAHEMQHGTKDFVRYFGDPSSKISTNWLPT